MITEKNYSKQTMEQYTSILPRNAQARIASELLKTKAQVQNCWYGKHYDEEIIRSINKHYKRVLKQHTK